MGHGRYMDKLSRILSWRIVSYIVRSVLREFSLLGRIVYGIAVAVPTVIPVFADRVGWPWLKYISELLPWTGWLWASFTLALFVMLIVIARRAYDLDADRIPKVTLSLPQEHLSPWQRAQEGHKVSRHFYLTVTNNSSGKIENCSIQEAEFVNNRSHIAPVSGRHFRLRREQQANTEHHAYTKTFDLRGMGDSVEIDVCSLDEGKPGSDVIMYYATVPTEHYMNSIPRSLFPHFLTIRVTADNMPIPIEPTYRIFVKPNGDLGMELIDAPRHGRTTNSE